MAMEDASQLTVLRFIFTTQTRFPLGEVREMWGITLMSTLIRRLPTQVKEVDIILPHHPAFEAREYWWALDEIISNERKQPLLIRIFYESDNGAWSTLLNDDCHRVAGLLEEAHSLGLLLFGLPPGQDATQRLPFGWLKYLGPEWDIRNQRRTAIFGENHIPSYILRRTDKLEETTRMLRNAATISTKDFAAMIDGMFWSCTDTLKLEELFPKDVVSG